MSKPFQWYKCYCQTQTCYKQVRRKRLWTWQFPDNRTHDWLYIGQGEVYPSADNRTHDWLYIGKEEVYPSAGNRTHDWLHIGQEEVYPSADNRTHYW